MSTYANLLELTNDISDQLKHHIRINNMTIETLADKLRMSRLVLKQIVLEDKVPLLRELVDITTELGLTIKVTLEEE